MSNSLTLLLYSSCLCLKVSSSCFFCSITWLYLDTSLSKVEVYKKAQDVAKEKVKEVEEQQNKEQQEIEKP
jgi:hypothetical protein